MDDTFHPLAANVVQSTVVLAQGNIVMEEQDAGEALRSTCKNKVGGPFPPTWGRTEIARFLCQEVLKIVREISDVIL